MKPRLLGKTGLAVSPIGFGAFKIGRNEKTKYSQAYLLPDDLVVERLLNGVLDLGVSYFDTAPAYGVSEERIGRWLSHRRNEFALSTKVGEIFEQGQSRYDFSALGVRSSIEQSLRRWRTDVIDLVLVHAHAADVEIQHSSEVVPTLCELKRQGLVRAIGLSGKTEAGASLALDWADVLMVEYHLNDQSHAEVIATAAERGLGVIVKKGLASGQLAADQAIRFALANPGVTSLVVGGLNLDHMRMNIAIATDLDGLAAS